LAGPSTLGDKRVDRIGFGAKLFAPDSVDPSSATLAQRHHRRAHGRGGRAAEKVSEQPIGRLKADLFEQIEAVPRPDATHLRYRVLPGLSRS
jgi:hypothetical protein